MRDIGCCHSRHNKLGRLVKNSNTACWFGVHSYYSHKHAQYILSGPKEIYISKFEQPETKRYRARLVWLINKITPCSIEEKGGHTFIKFKLLSTYDQSLVLLNFIRNLWYEPIKGYTDKFFKALIKSKKHYTDPLARLTWANKQAIPDRLSYCMGHCNVHQKSALKVKGTAQLFEYKGNSTATFLTTDEMPKEIINEPRHVASGGGHALTRSPRVVAVRRSKAQRKKMSSRVGNA